MLAIARKITLRLAGIEGCKLFGQEPPCLHLVIVWVSDEIDMDTLLGAAHCGTHNQ